MLKGPDARTERFLHDLTQINQRIGKAAREVSSGKRINSASDSPDEVSYLLSLRSNLSFTEQTKSNLGRVRTEVDSAEHVLGHAIEVVDRIQVLGAKGATDLLDAGGRRTIAGEIEQLLGQLVNAANTEIGGRFIFAGDTDQVAPYSFDSSEETPISAYRGSTTTRQAGHPSGGRFPISKTAAEVFDAPAAADNVFASVTALRNAMRDSDGPGIRAALANVQSAAKYLNIQQAFYGAVQNQVEEATDTAEKQIIRLKERISGVEDADITASILELNTARQVQETTLAVEGRRPRNSLFDYLG